jgi:hypothetical protein
MSIEKSSNDLFSIKKYFKFPNIFRDTEFDICITLVLLKRADGPNHYLNIKYDIIVEPLSTLNQFKMVGKSRKTCQI